VDRLPPPPRQPRVTCHQRARIALLDQERRTISARAIQLLRRRMRIVMDEPAPLSAPVSIETGDWLGLGEVCFCHAEYGHYVIELELDQMLIGLGEIAALQHQWLSQVAPPQSFVLHVPKQPLA
jgi:hypothetical protein